MFDAAWGIIYKPIHLRNLRLYTLSMYDMLSMHLLASIILKFVVFFFILLIGGQQQEV